MFGANYNLSKGGVLDFENYFEEKKNCIGKKSVVTDEKIVGALRQLSLGFLSE